MNKKIAFHKYQTDTETQEIENTHSLSQNHQKKLRLKYEYIDSNLLLSDLFAKRLASTTTGGKLSELITLLFDLLTKYDTNLILKNNSNNSHLSLISFEHGNNSYNIIECLLKFICENVESLITKAILDSSTELTSIIVLLVQLLTKLFDPLKLKKYYKLFLKCLRKTKNNKILNELINIWNKPNLNLTEETKEPLLLFLKKNLTNTDWRIRSKCIRILAFYYSSENNSSSIEKKIFKILLAFCDDQDPRVRITALELMISMHISGQNIAVEYYSDLIRMLGDDFDQVRLRACQLVCLLSLSYPEFMVILNSKASDLGVALGDEEKIRLVDDAFSKICLMINDISIEVKVCASCLLGKMEIVSSGFLLQTLDKKIMMDLKVRKFAKLRTKQLITSVDWASSSSNQAQSSSDSTMNDDDNLNLVTGGSCGAFIHGLEDEFLEVRGESVDALCSLALSCPKLAAKSIDFLVDMFNDEIESVRLKAIIALTKISHCVLLQDDQIDIVLGVIEDTSFEVRESLKVLLEQCRLATKIGLKKTVQALFKNLRKYFSDKYSIWRCFKHLGKHHAKFVISIISNLVGLHPFLDVTEPDINDVYYISSLILIYNAVNENSAILALLPKYIINHYFFLKLKLPELVPNINIIENAPLTQSLIDEKNSKIQEIKNFFFEAKTNFKISVSLNQYQEENSLKILESVRSDILYLSELNDSSLSVACEIMKGFIDCYLIIKRKELNTNSKIKIDNHKLIQIEEAIFKSIKLLMTFTGYSQKEKVILIQLYLFLRALYLKELCNRNSNYNINSYLKTNIAKQDLSKECRSYLSIIRAFEMLIKGEKLNPMTLQIIREIPFYELNELEFADKPECATSLNNGELEILLLTEKTNNYRKMWLDLLEPVSNLEMPIRFTPGLISNVRVKAVLNNFSRFDNLFIQIIYSDNDKQFFPIECSSFKEIQLNKHSLETFINLSNLSFTDNCYIKLCLVMYVDEYNDLKQQIVEASVENCLMRSTSASSHENESNTSLTMDKNLRNNFNIIELSVQIKLYFEPLLARKFM